MIDNTNFEQQMPSPIPFYEPEIFEAYVLEIYVPHRLSYLPRLYEFLKEQLSSAGVASFYSPLFRGYSLFEAKGAFAGLEQIYEEPTLVIQLIFDFRSYFDYEFEADMPIFIRGNLDARIMAIANQIIQITELREEEIWIMKYRAEQFKFVRRENVL